MVYVYYNLRLRVKQIEKVSNSYAISLDEIGTTSKWIMEMKDPVMDEAPEWLEEEQDVDAYLLEEEGEKEDVDVPLPEDEDIEEEVDIQVQRRPILVPPPPQSHTIGTRRKQLTLASFSSTLSTQAIGASSSTPGSSGPPPRPPTASRGKVVPFTRKRGRLIRGSSSGSR